MRPTIGQRGDICGNDRLSDGMNVKPFQLKADSAVGKTKNIGPLLLGFEPQILAQRLLGALNGTRIEIHDILRNVVVPNLDS